MTKVVNIRNINSAFLARPLYVYIGRGGTGAWGNPFKIGRDGTREEVIVKYKHLLWVKIRDGNVTKAMLLELEGKTLVCHCKPEACHGDVIVDAIKWVKGES